MCISAQIEKAQQMLPVSSDKTSLYLHLGALYSEIGMAEQALVYLTEALESEPDKAEVHYDMALFLSKQGRTADAIKHYSEALDLSPYYSDASNNLAWILATNGNPKVRDSLKAVRLAETACKISGYKDVFLLDTLAAAYAETLDRPPDRPSNSHWPPGMKVWRKTSNIGWKCIIRIVLIGRMVLSPEHNFRSASL
jgi:tetratricopeptide (TPR) repeat protein